MLSLNPDIVRVGAIVWQIILSKWLVFNAPIVAGFARPLTELLGFVRGYGPRATELAVTPCLRNVSNASHFALFSRMRNLLFGIITQISGPPSYSMSCWSFTNSGLFLGTHVSAIKPFSVVPFCLDNFRTHALKVGFWDVDEMANKIVAVLKYPLLQLTWRNHGNFEVRNLRWIDSARKCASIYEDMLAAVC